LGGRVPSFGAVAGVFVEPRGHTVGDVDVGGVPFAMRRRRHLRS
jgi:hypothetical protein